MENKVDNKNENSSKKKQKIMLIVLLLIIVAISIIFIKSGNPKVNETISKIPGINKAISSEVIDKDTNLDFDEEKERLQKEVEENTLNARIASSLNPDSEGVVYLSLRNKYDDKLLQVTIVGESNDQLYYTSPVLNPGEEVEFGKLSTIPVAGAYDCIAYFYYYTLDEEPISMVGAKVNLTVEGE